VSPGVPRKMESGEQKEEKRRKRHRGEKTKGKKKKIGATKMIEEGKNLVCTLKEVGL